MQKLFKLTQRNFSEHFIEENNNFHLFYLDTATDQDMSDEYAKVSRGKLKLKTDGEISKKKKKKKDKEKEREKIANSDSSTIQINSEQESSSTTRKLTKAEMSFKKMQDKMVSYLHLTQLTIF